MPNCIHMLLKNSIKMPIIGPSRGGQMKISIVKYCQIIWLCWSLLKKKWLHLSLFLRSSGAKLFFSFWKKTVQNQQQWVNDRKRVGKKLSTWEFYELVERFVHKFDCSSPVWRPYVFMENSVLLFCVAQLCKKRAHFTLNIYHGERLIALLYAPNIRFAKVIVYRTVCRHIVRIIAAAP